MAWGEKEGKNSYEADKEMSTDVIMRRPSYNGAGAEEAKAASGESMAILQSPLPTKIWKQPPVKSIVIIALTVTAVAIVVDMAVVVNTVAGAAAAAGAAAGAGLYILRLLWDAEMRAEAAIVGTAVAGGVAGTAAAILQSLLGTHSQRGSAVVGAMAGAAIVVVAGPRVQLVIDTIQWVICIVKWVLALVKRVIAAVQWCIEIARLTSLTETVIGVSKLALAAVFKVSKAGVAASGATGSVATGSGAAESGAAATAETATSEAAEKTTSEAEAAAGTATSGAAAAAAGKATSEAAAAGTATSEASAGTATSEAAAGTATSGAAGTATSEAAAAAAGTATSGAATSEAAAGTATSEEAITTTSGAAAGTSTSGAAASGSATSEPAAGKATSEATGTATSGEAGTATSEAAAAAGGTATSEAAGTATLGAAAVGTETSGAAAAGTATSGEAAAGTATSGAAAAGTATSGAAAAAGTAISDAAAGTATSRAAAGTATSGAAAAGAAASGTATSEVTEGTTTLGAVAAAGTSTSEAAAGTATSGAAATAISEAAETATSEAAETAISEAAAGKATSGAAAGTATSGAAAGTAISGAAAAGTATSEAAAAETATSEAAARTATSEAAAAETATPGAAETATPGAAETATSEAAETATSEAAETAISEAAAGKATSEVAGTATPEAAGTATSEAAAETATSEAAERATSEAAAGKATSEVAGTATSGAAAAVGVAAAGVAGAAAAGVAAVGAAALGIAAAAAGLIGGLVGELVAGSGSGINGSQQEGQSQTQAPMTTEERPREGKPPQPDESQTNEGLQTDEYPKTEESQKRDGLLQTDESPKTEEWLRRKQRTEETDKPQQPNKSPKTDGLPLTEESPKPEESLETDEYPKTDEFLQTDKFPKPDEPRQTIRSRTEKMTTEKEQSALIPDSPEYTEKSETKNSLCEQLTESFESNDSIKRENKDTGTAGVSPDQLLQQEKIEIEKIEHLFHRLHLHSNNILRAADVLQINEHSLQSCESCPKEELIQTFIQKLLIMNYRARNINVNKVNEQDHTKQKDNDSFENSGDIFDEMSVSNKGTSQSEQIHPMDVQMAGFHFADGFLKQLMVTKLSQCQYALPLLVPDPFTQQIEFPLWTFRQIHKSWKMRNNEIMSLTHPIYKAVTPMVFFFRFGSVSSSKSQLMNSLINERHNTFFHRNCPGSSRTRELMDGVVEITWFCPSGKNTDKFTDCVAFCNLHGDAGDHEKQLQILTEMSSVNVVLLTQLNRNDRHAVKIQNLYRDRKPLICLFTEDESAVTETKKGKFKIGLKDRNQSDVSEELRRAINACLSESSSTFRLEDVSKHSDIRVDEEDDEDCRRGREAAQQMMSLLEDKDLTEIKESFLPHQGKLWHRWCQKNKELHRPRADEIEMEISRKKKQMKKIREQQHESDISEFMKLFIKVMNSYSVIKKRYFLKWLRILLHEHISTDLSALHHKYDEIWSTVLKHKDNHGKSEQLTTEQTDLEKISEELQAATFGLEHIMREIGQIYESCSSVKKNKKGKPFDFSSLPSLAAEMMISGFPLELMDGDAAHVPLNWVTGVIHELIKKLGDQRVFVLSVLGIQSSGKSTMLNAMFGLQFAVSAGRCTRGAFMQLIKLSKDMKTQMKFDYILVVDTEGLRALELAGRSTRHHDNELATFVVGLGNLTLINIFGENPSEMQDILQIVVQAFLRMKKVNLSPSCVFVHQNVSDVTAGEKNKEGKRRLQKTLDEMTKLAAKDEVCDVECFSDVIRFDVQNDVKYFAQLWEGSPPMAPPNPDYCENIQELKETIMSHASKSHVIRLIHLKDRIKDLWEALLNERFVFSFRNSLEISAYRKLETEYSKWSWSLRRAMMETENKLHNNIENEAIHEVKETDLQRELKKTSEEVKKSMSDFFEKDTDADILIQWKTSFEIKIKELQENIVRETKMKLNEILQQRDLKKKIDAQKKHNENSLYEKSKELALKLKDKTNDKKTLKKEFDLFWKQCVEKIFTDTPAIKNIDIMRDVKLLLSDIYGSAPVSHWKESKDIVTVPSYVDYVQVKKSNGFIRTATEKLGILKKIGMSPEDETHLRTFVTDVAQQTDRMIQSFNISKMGYNISCIQQLTDYIMKRVTEHQEGPVKYVFKNEFFINLVLSICKRTMKMITVQQRMFRDANDPVIYVEKKRDEYYSIFQKYCHGATSAAIFGEIICQKLKEPIRQSVHKKTARDLADEMRSNCESLNGNRSNLEKHILKTLAEEEDFDKYMIYVKTPRDHFKSFIRDEVNQYIKDKFSASVLPKMKKYIELLQQKIMEAAHISTEHVQVNRGDVGLWLKSFTQQLSDVLIFSEKDLSGVKHDGVDDFRLLEEVIKKEIPAIMLYTSNRFNTKTFLANLDYKFRPDELLIVHFCQCCWVQCPFCAAICTNTIENHDGDHNVPFHRVDGIKGWHYRISQKLNADICTNLVISDKRFIVSDKPFPFKEYRTAGGVFADWNITPDLSELPYWKWFVHRFKKDIEEHYKKTFEEQDEILDEWKKITKQDAIESLDKYI